MLSSNRNFQACGCLSVSFKEKLERGVTLELISFLINVFGSSTMSREIERNLSGY